MAIDGVAPRAKMNQQRGRRFRSWREREEEMNEKKENDIGWKVVAEGNDKSMVFDSNCITPGTEFMQGLTEALRYFVERRVSEDEEWGRVKVVLSGAETPGEGEHKIMEYIRAMKMSGLERDVSHCVYGLDADLIILGLVTHEKKFVLLREKVDYEQYRKSKGPSRVETTLDVPIVKDEFELLSISVLRDYVDLDFGSALSKLPYYDVEKVIDDLVLLMLFIGNDFLPNLPKIEIHAGSLNAIIRLYKCLVPRLGGYISDAGNVNSDRFEIFVTKLALLEKVPDRRSRSRSRHNGRGVNTSGAGTTSNKLDLDIRDDTFWQFKDDGDVPWTEEHLNGHLGSSSSSEETTDDLEGFEISSKTKNSDISSNFPYYRNKLEFGSNFKEELETIKYNYAKGICWVLKYYYEGVASWRWFYPYHYAPMASDLTSLRQDFDAISFEDDTPFKPMEQLLSVLPPSSGWCLPKCFSRLMTQGPIAHFFPMDFVVDLNGKRNDWEGVVLLPFVPEEDLFNALAGVDTENLLTDREKSRNQLGPSIVYVRNVKNIGNEHKVVSPNRDRLPDFPSITDSSELTLPKLAKGIGFHAIGTENHAKFDKNVPTLKTLTHAGRLSSECGVCVFGFPSKNETMIIQLGRTQSKERDFVFFDSDSDEDEDESEGEDAPNKNSSVRLKSAHDALESGYSIGSHAVIGYPWKCDGIIERIVDCNVAHEKLSKSGTAIEGETGTNGILVKQQQNSEESFEQQVGHVAADLMERRALDIGSEKVLFGIRRAKERSVYTGRVTKYSDELTTVPSSTVLRPQEKSGASLGDVLHMDDVHALHPGDRIISLQPGRFYGVCGYVQNVIRDVVHVQFPLHSRAAKEFPFAYRVIAGSNHSEGWMTLAQLARMVQLPMGVLTKIVGSVRVRGADGETDLGLGIKYTSRGLFIPGYARRDNTSFLYSNRTKNLVLSYNRAFPEFFRMLGIYSSRDRREETKEMVFDAASLFPGKHSLERLQAVAAWVGASEVASLPLVTRDADVLSKDTVFALGYEALVTREMQKQLSAASGKPATFKISRSLVVSARSSSAGLPQGSVRSKGLHCGDRVVNWRGAGSVPFGLRGTVIGTHKDDVVEVVFDEPFIDGNALNGRCLENRGKAVEDHSLILIKPGERDDWYAKNYTRVRAECVRRYGTLNQITFKEERQRRELAEKFVQAGKSYAQASKQAPVPQVGKPVQAWGMSGVSPQAYAWGTTRASPQTYAWGASGVPQMHGAGGAGGMGFNQMAVGTTPRQLPVQQMTNPVEEPREEHYPIPSSLPLPKFLFKNGNATFRQTPVTGSGVPLNGVQKKTILQRPPTSHVKVQNGTTHANGRNSGRAAGVGGGLQLMTDGLKAMIGLGGMTSPQESQRGVESAKSGNTIGGNLNGVHSGKARGSGPQRVVKQTGRKQEKVHTTKKEPQQKPAQKVAQKALSKQATTRVETGKDQKQKLEGKKVLWQKKPDGSFSSCVTSGEKFRTTTNSSVKTNVNGTGVKEPATEEGDEKDKIWDDEPVVDVLELWKSLNPKT